MSKNIETDSSDEDDTPEIVENNNYKKRNLENTEVEFPKKKKSKNAPAEMRSDRPVRRLRVDADNHSKKNADPRFLTYTGDLNQVAFSKNYEFLDELRSKEISSLSKSIKKVNSASKKEELKQELIKLKQQHKERNIAKNVMNKLEDFKKDQKEKIKDGKNPFYLKKSAIKAMVADERYTQLKKEGKLRKYMEKKRLKNASKDRRALPSRRIDE